LLIVSTLQLFITCTRTLTSLTDKIVVPLL